MVAAGVCVLAWYRTGLSWRPLLRHDKFTGLDYSLTYNDKQHSCPHTVVEAEWGERGTLWRTPPILLSYLLHANGCMTISSSMGLAPPPFGT